MFSADFIAKKIDNCNIFITGGTGFFGKSLLKYFSELLNKGYRFNVFLLSRNPELFLANNSEFFRDEFKFIKGDIRDFELPNVKIDYFIHGATTASLTMLNDSPQEMTSVIADGTKYVLKKCHEHQEKLDYKLKKILYVSSGAVYGNMKSKQQQFSETDDCNPTTVYGKEKLLAEQSCLNSNIDAVIARCFTFIGEYLPRDTHFAVGNFINNASNNEDIIINSAGTAIRSYMSADDLVEWLLTILLTGDNGEIYNVGSDQEITIKELANIVKKCFGGNINIQINNIDSVQKTINRYVPNTSKAKNELHLQLKNSLIEEIAKFTKKVLK